MLLDLAANIGFGLAGAYGSKPKVAMFKPLDYGAEQKKSIGANIGAFPQIKELGDLYQSYLADQMEELLPGFSNILKSGASTTQQMLSASEPLLRGEIPQDVRDQIQRSSAYQAFTGGYAGSGMSHALTARDLGLTSLDLMGRGASLAGQGGNAAQRWASLARGQTLDPSSMFTTPQQTAAFDLQNRILRQQSLQNKYNVAAMPDPTMVGIGSAVQSALGQLGGVAGLQSTNYNNTWGGGSGAYQNAQSGDSGGGGSILSLLMGLI